MLVYLIIHIVINIKYILQFIIYYDNLIFYVVALANVSVNVLLSKLTVISCSVKIIANPHYFSWAMFDQEYGFINFNFENLLFKLEML